MFKKIGIVLMAIILAVALVSYFMGPASAGGDKPGTPTATIIPNPQDDDPAYDPTDEGVPLVCTPAWTETIEHEAITHTEYKYAKFTHTKTKAPYEDWSDYGPWTQWFPESHVSWSVGDVEYTTQPAFHGQGVYDDGTKWYREWQSRNTGEERVIVEQEAYTETVEHPQTGNCNPKPPKPPVEHPKPPKPEKPHVGTSVEAHCVGPDLVTTVTKPNGNTVQSSEYGSSACPQSTPDGSPYQEEGM